MVLVGCGVMPHAPMLIKPDEDQILHLPEIQQVHDACQELADEIRQRRPHAIVLVSELLASRSSRAPLPCT
jgi:hypothetical protein